jgi:hypothetical protein
MHVVWRKNFTAADKPVLVGLEDITLGEPTTMLYDVNDNQLEQLTRGIEAPICEFVRKPSSRYDGTEANIDAGLHPIVA